MRRNVFSVAEQESHGSGLLRLSHERRLSISKGGMEDELDLKRWRSPVVDLELG